MILYLGGKEGSLFVSMSARKILVCRLLNNGKMITGIRRRIERMCVAYVHGKLRHGGVGRAQVSISLQQGAQLSAFHPCSSQ